MVKMVNFWGEFVRAQVVLLYSSKLKKHKKGLRDLERKKNKFGYENCGLKYEIGLPTF